MSKWDQSCKNGVFNFSSNSQRYNHIQSRNRTMNDSSVLESLNRNSQGSISTEPMNLVNETNKLSFSEIFLHTDLLKWTKTAGFSYLKRVQLELLHNKYGELFAHYVICAPKQSGKTSAILLWIFHKLLNDSSKEFPKVLILCPTLEIANKTYLLANEISQYCNLKLLLAVKGENCKIKEKSLTDIIIATPDKVKHLPSFYTLKNVKFLVFDEAHFQCGSPGQLKIISYVISKLSDRCCIILSTLYVNDILQDFIKDFLNHHKSIKIENSLEYSPKEVFVTYSNPKERFEALVHLENVKCSLGQTVIFCKRETIRDLEKSLQGKNFCFKMLTGGLAMREQKCVLELFKKEKFRVLITTTCFVNSIESKNLMRVINYEHFLDREKKLDSGVYSLHKSLLNVNERCLVINFIEGSWKDFFFKVESDKNSTEQQVFQDVEIIPASELINGNTII